MYEKVSNNFIIISTFIVFIFCAISNKIFAKETLNSLTEEQRKITKEIEILDCINQEKIYRQR